jgi:hypothetical protein
MTMELSPYSGMTLAEAVEEMLAVSIAAYLGSVRRPRLKQAIELSIRTLDEWDGQRLGVTPEQLSMLINWTKTAPAGEDHEQLDHV